MQVIKFIVKHTVRWLQQTESPLLRDMFFFVGLSLQEGANIICKSRPASPSSMFCRKRQKTETQKLSKVLQSTLIMFCFISSALQWTTSEPSINFWAIRAIKSETAVHSAVEDAYKEKILGDVLCMVSYLRTWWRVKLFMWCVLCHCTLSLVCGSDCMRIISHPCA